MPQPSPIKLVEPFAKNAPNGAAAGNKTNPFPVPSQIPLGSPGSASLNDGFTILNMTALGSGGIPPSGADMNGIFYLYGTTLAAVGAGQVYYPFDGAYATAIGGYDKGAIVRDAANSAQFWISSIVTNSTDPAAHPENWISSVPLHSSSAPTAGTHADNLVPGPSDYMLDVDTTAGNVTLNGFVSQRDGQRLTISNTGANSLTIGFSAGTAANQVRGNGSGVTLLNGDSVTIQYCAAISRWVVV